ncbi:MAG TPA: peptide chain release factor N(5)-glutamine methyltransferase [Tepidisphaeraceae bacterium]|jgi:release factor glutamine methyltransferase|nr:peptide chain release factor N(5)-glutamine methyltransferase [Tepidisphaeraceae bacterium]
MSQPTQAWTIRRLLEWTSSFFSRKQVDSPRLAAELLLAHVLNVPRIKLYTDYERILEEPPLSRFRALVQRASEHEPIAYLTGHAHFFGLEFEVNRSVLIPRPDTELIVENVLQLARHQAGMEAPRILDLCTGSGCIAAAIAYHLKNAIVLATDISKDAAEVARKNIEKLGLNDRVTVEVGDLFEPLAQIVDARPFDLIVSNPPYVSTTELNELDRNVKEYEPVGALDGGIDGLLIHRKILAGASERLVPGGRLYLEIGYKQADAAREAASHYPDLENVMILRDLAGNDRVLTAIRKKIGTTDEHG